jgi:hypothetical protein
MHEQTEVSIKAAGAVLERKAKLETAIADGVAELQNLILAQLESERTFRRLEAAAAIGEPAPDLPKAKKAAMDARAALDQASLRLNGFRAAVGELGSPLVETYDRMALEVPRHNAHVAAEFAPEWHAALSNWNLALGRRAAIERVIGQSLDLPEPAPAAVQIGDAARPAEVLSALETGIKAIASAKKLSERPLKAGSYRDPLAIFKVTTNYLERRGIAKGTLIIAASLRVGELDQLIELEEVRPILDRDQIPGVTAAALKADQIDKVARDKQLAKSEALLHTAPLGEQSTRRYDLEAERNYRPPAGKTTDDTAAGIAAASNERDLAKKRLDPELEAAEQERIAKLGAGQVKLRSTDPAPKVWPESALL